MVWISQKSQKNKFERRCWFFFQNVNTSQIRQPPQAVWEEVVEPELGSCQLRAAKRSKVSASCGHWSSLASAHQDLFKKQVAVFSSLLGFSLKTEPLALAAVDPKLLHCQAWPPMQWPLVPCALYLRCAKSAQEKVALNIFTLNCKLWKIETVTLSTTSTLSNSHVW